MSRKKRALKRPTIQPDKTFNSVLVSQLVNRVMKDGKKTIASKIVLESLVKAGKNLEIEPIKLLEVAVNNVKPQIEVKSVRVGGANYQVPIEPYPRRALRLSLTWIVESARKIKGKSMQDRLLSILTQSYNNEGPAVETRKRVRQTAIGNRAFTHLASRINGRKNKK